MSRRKGSAFERAVAAEFIQSDGLDEHIQAIASSAGRVGHLDIGADIVTRRFAIEAKHRESLSELFWTWLDHIHFPQRIKLLVVKKNRHRPLVVLYLDDFLTLTRMETPDELPRPEPDPL